MQSILNQPDIDAWAQLAPLLDAALAELGETDRTALVLRFFENKTAREIAGALRMEEAAAQKRVARALEKLRAIFAKRGVTLSPTDIAGTVAANSVQAAPPGLAVAIMAVATKGAAVSTSTLTLVKGALKIMAWTKTKTAVVVGVGVLLATGTATTFTIKEIQHHRLFVWQVPKLDPANFGLVLASAPPQVNIVPSKFLKFVGLMGQQNGPISATDGNVTDNTNEWLYVGICVSVDEIVRAAYHADSLRTIFSVEIPKGNYDFISDLPNGSPKILQEQVKKKFGLVGNWKMVETNVLALKFARPNAQRLKPTSDSGRNLERLIESLQNVVGDGLPVINMTGLTNGYDFSFNWPKVNTASSAGKRAISDALSNQLGLELVPTNIPIEMLVVEKVK